MSFPATVFRILIASPSDVVTERDIAVKVIQQWNNLNAAERHIVILPLMWETHSAPEYGKRPQEVINRQIVDYCDLLIGIFWTRVGTPTGTAESGTIEEIERVANAGKLVMLYFSQAKQDLDKVDLDQLSKLREFKRKTFPKALIETYADPIEFHDKLSKQIDIQLRGLLAEQSEGRIPGESDLRTTDILFHFGDPKTGRDLGEEIRIETTFIEIKAFNEIPNYTPKLGKGEGKAEEKREAKLEDMMGIGGYLAPWTTTALSPSPNIDYYRELANYLTQTNFFKPLRFWFKDGGGIGARDVYINLEFKSNTKNFIVVNSIPSLPSKLGTGYALATRNVPAPEDILKTEGQWNLDLEIPALQPQREFSPVQDLYIGAKESCEVTISARIYADILSQPLSKNIKLSIQVKKEEISGKRFFEMVKEEDGESANKK